MRIREVRWSNYRRMPDDGIEVRNHLVLVGPNDSGKSSVLRAINICLGVPGAQLGGAIDERDFTDPAQPVVLRVELVDFDDDDRAAFPDEISTLNGESLTVEVEAVMDGDAEQKQVRRRFPYSGHNRSASKVQMARFGWAFVPANRSLYRELGGGAASVVRTLLSGIDLGADQGAFDAAANAYTDAIANATALQTFRGELAEALTDALPRAVKADDLEVTSEAALSGDPLAGVTVTVSDGQYRAPLAEQSDGIRALSVLSLFGMTHEAARIVGVDEPEIHLHHTAQRTVARRLQTSPGQRVVVTHAPAIVQEMDPVDLVVMTAARSPRQLPLNAPMAQFEGVTRFWAPDLIEPLTARAVLLVEGASDRILCEKVANLLNIDLNRVGVSLFDMGGAGLFDRAFGLFGPNGFDLGLYGLVDEDARATWAEVLGVAPADLGNSGCYSVCEPDLEGVYVAALGFQRTLQLLLASPNVSVNAIQQSTGLAITDLTEESLAEFCRKSSFKMRAALAVAAGLTPAEAQTLTPLVQLLAAATV